MVKDAFKTNILLTLARTAGLMMELHVQATNSQPAVIWMDKTAILLIVNNNLSA